MEYQTNIKYPCGFEHKIYTQTGIFDTFLAKINIDDNKIAACPIHGQNCKVNP